jgi:putative ABC transport system ATP-binding protein
MSMVKSPAGVRTAARVVGATKLYGRGDSAVCALDDVSVEFPAAAFTAIMGPSGSGKSTLLHCLAGLDTLTSGQVLIGDTDVSGLSEQDLTLLRRNRLGFIFQTYNLVPTLTAEENIVLPLRLGGRKADPEWLARVVEAVGLSNRLKHTPAELSGGQQQRVAAARALITRPEIVFADEPTGALDSRSSGDLLRFLRHAADEYGQTIVMVTHDAIAAGYADRVLFLRDGRVVDEMTEPTADRILDAMKGLGE